MKNSKNTRMCIVCRGHKPKEELVRVVKTPEGSFLLDKTGKANGRGAYVCKNGECINKAFETRAFNRSFKCEIKQDEIKALREMLADIDG